MGYIYYLDWYEFYKSKNWRYRFDIDEDIDFIFTSAHETGHEILKKYGGTFYSYGHKGSVNSVTQNMKDDAPEYSIDSEVTLCLIIQNLLKLIYSKTMLPQKKIY